MTHSSRKKVCDGDVGFFPGTYGSGESQGSYTETHRIQSISVLPDLRILYRIRNDGTILLIDVGDHLSVYGKIKT